MEDTSTQSVNTGTMPGINQQGETISPSHRLMGAPSLLPSDPIPTAPAGETSPRDLLLDDHEQRLAQLRARVEALEREVSRRATSGWFYMADWIEERIAELYGHLGLHQTPRK